MKRPKRYTRRRERSTRRRVKPQRVHRLEWLEPRAMLTGVPLATLTDALATAGQQREIGLTLAGAAQPVVLSFQVRGTSSSLDPAPVQIQNQAGVVVTPLSSQEGINGTLISRVTVALPAGEYDVLVGGENNTTGPFEIQVYLSGDQSGNQQVSDQEYAQATAAMLQSQFGFNHVAAMVFAKQGIDVSQNQYRAEFDLDASGTVDLSDREIVGMNRNLPTPMVSLAIPSQQAPQIQAALTGDTGISNSDGITNNTGAMINGTISDDGTIVSFTASIDGSTAVELGTLLGQNFATGGSFSLNLSRLEQIAGTGAGSLTNDGAHTLMLTARDDQGNTPATPVQIIFSFDTIAPAAPAALDLDASSDTGPGNSDNITSDTTPTISGVAEANSLVQLFSSLVTGPIGQATANGGTFTITTIELPAGVNNITARATDVAGNVSAASGALIVTIDTTPPAAPAFDLAPESDTGTVGDRLTTNTTVILRGSTEPGASVVVRRGGSTVGTATADTSGLFSIGGVALPFGASQFQVTATDLAGASTTSSGTITRNDAPSAPDQSFTVDEGIPVGTVVGTVAATDANLGEGDALSFAITSGNTNNAFAINAATGEIRVANPAAVDFETTPTFTLIVTVTDSGGNGSGTAGTGLSDTATITIDVSPPAPHILAALSNDTGRSNTDGITNDVDATISGSISDDGTIASFTASIDGSTPVELGTLLGQNFASGGNFALTLADLETIAGTGAGSLVNDGMHTLRLIATDDQAHQSAPMEIAFEFDTLAPAAPTALDLAAASDTGPSDVDNITADATPTINGVAEANARVQLLSSLAGGAIGESIVTGSFSITASMLVDGAHTITATATDVAGNVSEASEPLVVTIDTTPPATPDFDLAPEFDTGEAGDHLTTATVVSLVGLTEAGLSVVLRQDGDIVATVTADDAGEFAFTDVSLPFGATAFEVTVMDLAGGTGTLTRTITRNDAPVASDATFTLMEESPVGTVVGTVSAADANLGEGDALSFAITSGNTNNAFAINASTGQIRIANPAAVDFEATPTFTLIVTVTDSGGNGSGTAGTGLLDTATITINLLDGNDAPMIVDQSFQLAENSANGAVVGTVAASDQNAGDSLTFEIVDGNSAGAFAIDPVSGELTVADSAALDFETTPTFTLTVAVTDVGILSQSASVTISLENVNEAPVVADGSFTVPRISAVGQSLGTVAASDPDAGDTLAFEIVASNAPSGAFAVDSTTGNLTVADPTVLVPDAVYVLTVRATDLGGTGLNDEGVITLTVTSNTAPLVAGDVFQVVRGSTNNELAVLANDSDPDPGDVLTVTNVTAPQSGGTAVISGNGQSVLYTPAAGFLGTDRFTYTVSDGHGGTTQMLATVQVIQVAPALDAHFHANLSIFINGDQQPNPPANVGRSLQTTVIAPVHTEAADGQLHISPAPGSPTTQPVTVGDFFTTWRTNAGAAGNNPNAIFTADQVLGHMVAADEVVRMYVNGLPVAALGDYVLRPEDQIVIAVEKIAAAANAPSFVPIADQIVLAGSPLHIPLQGFDPNSTSLTFTAMSSNTNVLTTEMAAANRSLLMDVAGLGQMTFELFEDQVPGITENIIALVQSGILDETIFHRVIPGFVAQGLDPTGTGFGHPGLLDFDDQYDPDLQHNSSGLLSMAKAGDDTNSSQVFITDVNPAANPNSVALLRNLDFNHSIFGRLTSGENVRRQIMQAPVGANDRPQQDILIENVEIIQVDNQAVLRLKAPEGTTGEADITVTARDAQGNEFTQTFHVTVQPDTFNGTPFFTSTPANVQTTANTPVDLTFQAFDVEGDPTMLQAAQIGLEATILFDNTGDENGITPPGTTSVSYLGAHFSGGTVTTTGTTPLASSGSAAYVFGQGGGQVTFDVPLTLAAFYFVHPTGQTPYTATAFGANGNVLGTVTSNTAGEYNDPDNFEAFAFATPIARIAFNGGYVDNFEFRAQPVPLTFQINQVTHTVTVTPPNGFVGTMAILVGVGQATGTPPNSVDPIDRQTIPITVLPAGASAAIAPPEDDSSTFGDDAIDAVFDEIGAL